MFSHPGCSAISDRLPVDIFRLVLALMLALWFSFFIPPSLADSRFDNSMIPRGLPIRLLGGINKISQDGHGFIWFGGENGLGKYDGVKLRVYQSDGSPGSLPSDYIWDLAVDKSGQLWIATSRGLCVYRTETDSFEVINPANGKAFLHPVITALRMAGDKLYVGSILGLNRVDLPSLSLDLSLPTTPPYEPGNNTVQDISVSATGEVWIATEFRGIARLSKDESALTFYTHDDKNPYSVSASHVRALYHDSNDRMWVGTYGGGINLWDAANERFLPVEYPAAVGDYRSSVIMDIKGDRQGNIWVSTDQHGLLKFAADGSFSQHFAHVSGDETSLLAGKTRTVFEDREHDLWIGMFPYGISFLDRSKESIQTYRSDEKNPQTLSDNAILSFVQDRQGLIWVGTEGGLNVLDPHTGLFTRYLSDPKNPKALAANPVLSVAQGKDDDIWVGTWSGGLHRLNYNTREFTRYGLNKGVTDAFVWSVFRDSFGTLWVGTETGGLQFYRPESDDFGQYKHDAQSPTSLPSNFVRSMIEDNKHRLWIATAGGIGIFDLVTQQFQRFAPTTGDDGSVAHESYFCVFQDSKGFIWIGGNDKGVVRIEPESGAVKRIGVRDGLPSSTVMSFREDKSGNLWLATFNGIARIDKDLAITTFNVEHGLIGATHNRNASLLAQDGRLYFGSTEGITAFLPEDMEPKLRQHPVLMTNFRILNENITAGAKGSPLTESILTASHIQLNHEATMFSFDFVLLNYRNATLNTYSYKLDNFDKRWNDVNQSNTATYTNLDAGDYVFHVRARAPGEQWLEMKPVTITIAPAPWLTWWAYCIYAALIALAAYVVYTMTRLKHDSDVYKELAETDTLAGAYNRAGVAQIVKRLFADEEAKSRLCIMLLDIDHFKKINDERGHSTGDKVIRELVTIAKASIRANDCFGRWGGEEFIVICPLTSAASAFGIAEKIRVAIAEHEFDTEHSLKVSVSIGITLVQKTDSFDVALERADKALYEAKTSGRNRSVLLEAQATEA